MGMVHAGFNQISELTNHSQTDMNYRYPPLDKNSLPGFMVDYTNDYTKGIFFNGLYYQLLTGINWPGCQIRYANGYG